MLSLNDVDKCIFLYMSNQDNSLYSAHGTIIRDLQCITIINRHICYHILNLSCYCFVLYCIMRPDTDGPIGPLSYRHSSGVVRNPHSTLAE